MKKILFFLCIIFSSSANAALTIPAASAIQSRTADGVTDICYTPCLIYFDASGVTSTETTKPFHDLYGEVSFGKTNAGYYAYGIQGSKNYARGMQAATVYETAGTYIWTYRFREPSGAVGQRTGTVVVTDWPLDNKTACVNANSADFTGCPANATQINQGGTGNWGAAVALLTGASCGGAACNRVLLKAGDSFTYPSVVSMGASSADKLIGMYGAGAKPIVSGSGKMLRADGVISNLRIVDLLLTGSDSSIGQPSTNASFRNLLLLRFDTQGIKNGIAFDANDDPNSVTDLFAWVDGQCLRSVGPAGMSCVFANAKRVVTLGNNMVGNGDVATAGTGTTAEQLLRMNHVIRAVSSNNSFSNVAESKELMAIRSNDTVAITFGGLTGEAAATRYLLVSGNIFTLRMNNVGAVFMGPNLNAGPTGVYLIRDLVIENNYCKFSTGGKDCFDVKGDRVTVRNNVMNTTGAQLFNEIGISITPAVNAQSGDTNFTIENNTAYTADSNIIGVLIAEGTNGVARNNLTYAPLTGGGQRHSVRNQSTGAVTLSNNSTNLQLTTNPSFINRSGTLSAPADFRIPTTSYAATGGTAVFPPNDFFNCADIDTSRNRIGALVPEAWATCAGGVR